MDVLCFLSWRVASLLLLIPCTCNSLNVRILNEGPVHVIPGSNLLLRAHIESSTQDKVSMVTWERETETGPTPNRRVLATCPGSSQSPCAGTLPNVLANMGKEESTLQISGYQPADGGDYIVTVTHQNGNKTSARCIVREYEAVHHVSVSINVSHSVLVCGEAWGTEPHFSWLYNRRALTQTVGQVSPDGTRLYITQRPICGCFTCMVQNKLGYATATYTAGNCDPEDHSGTIAAVVCVLLLFICGGLLGLLLWRRHQRNSITRERLHEHMDG
ncbi:uncharacterized protein si:dkeyp-97a10.2 [Periophthalmus magnuspinnatus]|uniref:uncharacterized protein si:dkeyp-97a10.2 n=1 Tax=Periophthalmus magnuspinnatus TaxID=409849 RepID=UPI00145A54CB|nr:uncharacterized protein si:dkeyp-97a10.2 [Periophthalmus magnuspinnatus]XP_033837082.1 uncharacterized protein si:dkeyp-97a10.2 [Periophthalmus magnuspinnatus]